MAIDFERNTLYSVVHRSIWLRGNLGNVPDLASVQIFAAGVKLANVWWLAVASSICCSPSWRYSSPKTCSRFARLYAVLMTYAFVRLFVTLGFRNQCICINMLIRLHYLQPTNDTLVSITMWILLLNPLWYIWCVCVLVRFFCVAFNAVLGQSKHCYHFFAAYDRAYPPSCK